MVAAASVQLVRAATANRYENGDMLWLLRGDHPKHDLPLPRWVHGQSLNDRAPRFTFHATRKRPEGLLAAPNWHRGYAFLPGKPGMIPISDDNPVEHAPFVTW